MSPSDILQQLSSIASEHVAIAVAWHIAIAVTAIVLVRWQPSTEQATLLVVAPVISVFLAAAGHSSWFNAISFGVLAVALTASRANLAPRWRTSVPAWSSLLGTSLIAFGVWYPHFTEGAWYRSLYTSPIGLLPCPTLAVIGGFTLLAGGFGSRTIPALLAAWTGFYGAFGAFRLGVAIDILLLPAALGLARLACHHRREHLVVARN
jgi:hypothetical protein